MAEDIYPMPFFAMLIVADLEASSKWYQEVLGFTHIFTMPGPGGAPALVHLRWVKYADLLLTRSRDSLGVPAPRGNGVSLNFQMFDRFAGDIEALAKHAREQGAVVSGPVDQPWNVRELTVLDPDGYRLIFTRPTHIGQNFDKLLDKIVKAGEV